MAHILPSGGGKALLDSEDALPLLLDQQSGLFQTVKDITVAELRANVSALPGSRPFLSYPSSEDRRSIIAMTKDGAL